MRRGLRRLRLRLYRPLLQFFFPLQSADFTHQNRLSADAFDLRRDLSDARLERQVQPLRLRTGRYLRLCRPFRFLRFIQLGFFRHAVRCEGFLRLSGICRLGLFFLLCSAPDRPPDSSDPQKPPAPPPAAHPRASRRRSRASAPQSSCALPAVRIRLTQECFKLFLTDGLLRLLRHLIRFELVFRLLREQTVRVRTTSAGSSAVSRISSSSASSASSACLLRLFFPPPALPLHRSARTICS